MTDEQKHLADLRNKFGRVSSYFQIRELLEVEGDPVKIKKLKELLSKHEETIYDDVRRFTELLKK